MSRIERYEVNQEWAHSGIVKAGDFCFLSYCVGNVGGTIEEQINGAFDNMEERLAMVGLTLENAVRMAYSSRQTQLHTAVSDKTETGRKTS